MRIFSSPIYMGVLALLFIVLSVRVVLLRGRYQVKLGDGGNEVLQRAIRAHANFVEYVPLALLLMLAADLVGHDKIVVHTLGITLVIARVAHAFGVSTESGRSLGRAVGIALTLLVLIAGAVLACLSFWQIRV